MARRKKKARKRCKRLPPRHKSGPRKGQFKKRKRTKRRR